MQRIIDEEDGEMDTMSKPMTQQNAKKKSGKKKKNQKQLSNIPANVPAYPQTVIDPNHFIPYENILIN